VDLVHSPIVFQTSQAREDALRIAPSHSKGYPASPTRSVAPSTPIVMTHASSLKMVVLVEYLGRTCRI